MEGSRRAAVAEGVVTPARALAVLVCGTAILAISFGTRTSFGIFLAPVSADLGWGREVFALAIAVQNLLWGASQPIAGAIADKFGAGRVVAVCAVLYAAGLALMAEVTTPLGVTTAAGILVGIAMSGTGFPVILAVIGRSVPAARRSLFLGLAAAGGSSGQLLMVPLGQGLLDAFGWAQAFLILALVAATMVPMAAALAGAPVEVGESAPQRLGEALREAGGHRGFWLLNAGFFVCGFHVMFIATHLPAYIVDRGVAPAMGAVALALIGVGNIFGSYLAGVLGGRWSKKGLLSGLYLLRSVVIAGFVAAPLSDLTVMAFALAIGVLWLSTVPLTSGLVGQIFGVRYMATLFGIVFFSHQLGAFLGIWLGGLAYDLTGSYDAVWWLAVVLGVAAAVLHAPIDERPLAAVRAAVR